VFIESLLAVYVKILELNVCKAFIFVLLLAVYDSIDDEKLFRDATEASELVISDISIPLYVSEPVIAALCINICYDLFYINIRYYIVYVVH
jgi:hypothetical protein